MTARATIRERIDQDLAAAFKAWAHLVALGLASQTVCMALWGRWGLCACGQCDTTFGGGR